MTTQTKQVAMEAKQASSFLRTMLRVDAVFSDISGLSLVVGSRWLADLTGLPSLALVITGVGLMGWAVWVWLNTREVDVRRGAALTVIIGNGLWVAASIILLVGGFLPLTVAGTWAMAIVADIVATFAIVQVIGLRRM